MGSTDFISFYDQLDYIAVEFVPGLTQIDDPDIASIRKATNDVCKKVIKPTALNSGKPILLAPVFYSTDGSNKGNRQPMDFSAPVDMQEQVDEWEGFFQAILDLNYISAVSTWGYWREDSHEDLDMLTSASIRAKPAKKAVKLWFEIYNDSF